MSVSCQASSLGLSKENLADEADEKEPVTGRDGCDKFASLEELGKEDNGHGPASSGLRSSGGHSPRRA